MYSGTSLNSEISEGTFFLLNEFFHYFEVEKIEFHSHDFLSFSCFPLFRGSTVYYIHTFLLAMH